MSDEPTTPTADRDQVLEALVQNTRALTTLQGQVASLQQEYSEGKQSAKETANSVAAKLDNLDRSVSEVKLASENNETARKAELTRIYNLLQEERQDRRKAISEGKDGERAAVESEREMLREMIREEMGVRKTNKNLAVAAAKEVWRVGGQYIVAALALVFVAVVMKMTGLSLADIIGLAGK